MGAAGADPAIEATDRVLMQDDWRPVPDASEIGRRGFATIKQDL